MGMSVISLSELIGVSRQSIDQFEKGVTTPSEVTLVSLIEKLNHPREFFFKAMPEFSNPVIFYRSKARTGQTVKRRVEVRMSWLCELVSFLDKYVNLIGFQKIHAQLLMKR
jgi:transcriptional regulator with XRE-family HTH domain